MELESKLIVNSAWIIDWEVYTGKRHSDCLKEYIKKWWAKNAVWVQGFITDDWVFLSRELAAKIAEETGQGKPRNWILFSEDLW